MMLTVPLTVLQARAALLWRRRSAEPLPLLTRASHAPLARCSLRARQVRGQLQRVVEPQLQLLAVRLAWLVRPRAARCAASGTAG